MICFLISSHMDIIYKMCIRDSSCSVKARFLSSHDSWNAVIIGSLEDNAMSEGLDRALYSLTLDIECRKESSSDSRIHTSHPHLKYEK